MTGRRGISMVQRIKRLSVHAPLFMFVFLIIGVTAIWLNIVDQIKAEKQYLETHARMALLRHGFMQNADLKVLVAVSDPDRIGIEEVVAVSMLVAQRKGYFIDSFGEVSLSPKGASLISKTIMDKVESQMGKLRQMRYLDAMASVLDIVGEDILQVASAKEQSSAAYFGVLAAYMYGTSKLV